MKWFGNIFAVFALVALVGCTKTELDLTTPAKEITFTVGQYATRTKAVSLDKSEDAIFYFRSKGFLHAEGVSGAQDFFGADGETISARDASGNIISSDAVSFWAPSHPYYWPKSTNSYVNFVSWYDKNVSEVPNTLTEESLVWTFDNSRPLRADDNIMYADMAWHYNQNTNNAKHFDEDAITSGVPTLFHHAMSKVRVQVKRKTSNASTTISVTDFKLSSVYNTGSLILSNSEPVGSNSEPVVTTTKAWTGSWNLEGCTPVDMTGKNVSLSNTEPQEVFAMQTMIPQLTDNIKVEFKYKIKSTFTSGDYIEETVPVVIALSSFTNAPSAWNMNTKITYTIVIDPDTYYITLAPVLTEDWGDGEYITVPVEPDES